MPKHILILFRGGKYNIPKLVDQMVDLAMLARQSGLLALEEKAEVITAYRVGKEKLEAFALRLGELTDEERQIILKGCLINYNRV